MNKKNYFPGIAFKATNKRTGRIGFIVLDRIEKDGQFWHWYVKAGQHLIESGTAASYSGCRKAIKPYIGDVIFREVNDE